jgi:hypothetical protein
MKEIIDIASTLGDESRMRILLCLKDSTLCLCHLTEILGFDKYLTVWVALCMVAGVLIGKFFCRAYPRCWGGSNTRTSRFPLPCSSSLSKAT